VATAPYDADRHHVGLGEDEDSLVGLLLEGAFRRSLQPATPPASFGSGVDYLNNPSISRWSQDDFSGGAFNYQWGEDTAMFAYCTSVLPSLLAKSARTVPPIVKTYAKNDQTALLLAFARGTLLVLVRPGKIQTYDTGTNTFTEITSPASTPITAAVYDAGAEMLYLAAERMYVLTVPAFAAPGRSDTATVTIATPGVVTLTGHGLSADDVVFFTTTGALPTGLAVNTSYFVVEIVSPDSFKVSLTKGGTAIDTTGTQSGVHTAWRRLASQPVGYRPQIADFAYPATNGFLAVDALANGRSFLAAACDGNRLYTLSIPASKSGSPVWTENSRLPGHWRDYAVYNGVIYVLCADAYNNTSIFTFDGANVVPVTDFPYNFEGVCIQVYAGRVYVGGAGRDFAGNRSYAEFYEVTGSSLRLVRTFTPEVRDGGEVTPFANATQIRAMGVHEGLLYLGFDSYGLIAYDVVTDSLYGASEFKPAVSGAAVWKMLTTNQSLNLWVDSTTPADRGLYRTAHLGEAVPPYEGQLVTSDFGPQPATEKRWSELRVVSRYGDVTVEYSEDGGESYVALDGEMVTEGSYRHNTVDLSALPVSKRIRFRFTMQRNEDSSSYTELIGFTLAFLFLSTGKRTWSFSVNATARVQGKDDQTQVQDPAAIFETLQGWAADRTPLVYKDVDGESRTVSITRLEDFKPVIGLPLDSERGLEGFYALTLTEV